MRWTRPIVGLGLILSISMLAGCAGAGAGFTAGASSAEPIPSTTASEAAVATAPPTAALTIPTIVLPTPSFDPKKVAVACDQAALGAGASMTCNDVVTLAVRVAATMTRNPVTQVAVTKPADNPNGIQVTFWAQAEDASGLTAFTTTIDPANGTVTFPIEDPQAVFPTAS